MIPEFEAELYCRIPPRFGYWAPLRSDMEDEEGIGFFQDVWPISDVSLEEARFLVGVERATVEQVGALAQTVEEFEELVRAVEGGDQEAIDVREYEVRPSWVEFWRDFPDEFGVGERLDLGVSGMVHALAALGLVPVASCRGHGRGSWSPFPVVFFATDASRAHAILSRASSYKCGLEGGTESRAAFLTVFARSVVDMNALADRLLADAAEIGTDSIIVPDEELEEFPPGSNQTSFDIFEQ